MCPVRASLARALAFLDPADSSLLGGCGSAVVVQILVTMVRMGGSTRLATKRFRDVTSLNDPVRNACHHRRER